MFHAKFKENENFSHYDPTHMVDPRNPRSRREMEQAAEENSRR
jgi:hypothetical protein